MKKISLFLLMPLSIICMQKPAAPGRPGTPMPKSPPLKPSAHKIARPTPPHLLKMATCGINIWCNENCDEQLWAHMVSLFRCLEDEPFNKKALLQTILDEIELSSNKKGNGVWGGLSFTYITDSEKLDKETNNQENP